MQQPVWRAVTEFLLLSGLRIGEFIALEKSDVDFNARQIHVTKTYDVVNHLVTDTKTLESRRDVYMQDDLYAVAKQVNLLMLKQRVMHGYQTRLFAAAEDGGLVLQILEGKIKEDHRARDHTTHTAAPLCQVHDKKIFIFSCPHNPAFLIGILPPPVSVRRQKTHEVAPFLPAAYTQKLCRLFCNKTQFA